MPANLRRRSRWDWDPIQALRISIQTLVRALVRLWGRDVMLFTGGVSFFIMLAIFPALAILVGLYSLLADPAQAAHEGEALSKLMPVGARDIFRSELLRLTTTPHAAISTQSGLALLIGVYAAHRGFKALLAGLSFIHDEDKPRGFVGFNVLALVVLVATFSGLGAISAVFLGIRVMGAAFELRPLRGVSWLYSEWTWASAGLSLGLACIYRFAMSSRPVAWRASAVGGVAATALCLGASWAIAIYVEQVAHLGATYGSIAAVVIFLIWLSWNVNAIFFGGALATEVELALEALEIQARPLVLSDMRGAKPLVWPPKN
jgi:membrane protein